ncbi:MAG: hypothetical protein R6X16_00635, partial [Anaerolineae bacterium]
MTDDNRSTGSSGDKPVVRVQRRRRGSGSTAPRQRAEAPRREGRQTARTTTPAAPTGTGSTGGSWTTGPTGASGSTGGAGGSMGSLLGSLLQGATSGSGGATRRAGGCSPRTLVVLVALGLLVV